jgi:hypothetical protein
MRHQGRQIIGPEADYYFPPCLSLLNLLLTDICSKKSGGVAFIFANFPFYPAFYSSKRID